MSINYSKRLAKDFNKKTYFNQLCALYLICAPFLWFFYRYEVKGRHNIPKGERFICAGNHISYFDPFLAALAVIKPLAFMAKKELFETEKLAKTLAGLGAFAVNREKLEVSTIKTVKEIFKTPNWCLGIFPQGGIRKNHTIEKINKGFAVIAKSAKVNILPVSITGCEKYNWIPFKGKIIVEIGELISHEQEIDEIIDEWGRKVADMADYKYITTAQEYKEAEEKELQKEKSFA